MARTTAATIARDVEVNLEIERPLRLTGLARTDSRTPETLSFP
jgi:hypothetical protein